jgi:hypothetical protein
MKARWSRPRPLLVAAFAARCVQAVAEVFERPFKLAARRHVERGRVALETVSDDAGAHEAQRDVGGLEVVRQRAGQRAFERQADAGGWWRLGLPVLSWLAKVRHVPAWCPSRHS